MFSSAAELLSYLTQHEISYVDFRFTDLLGVWHHMTFHARAVKEALLEEGIFFDGSSIAGWCKINSSDMLMRPDIHTAVRDPFAAQSTLLLFCDIWKPEASAPYARDPRSIARRAEQALLASQVADVAYFGPEPEFFIFDQARFDTGMQEGYYHLDAMEGPYNSGRAYPEGNLAHRPFPKGGYFPVMPVDSLQDMRSEMLSTLAEMGVEPEKHHHEVAASQHELGFCYNTLVRTADNLQIYKYVVKNVALTYGKTATFMPKPIMGDNGSGMHVHQSLWKKGAPLFRGDLYAGLSQEALYYIGGLMTHARALNAFTNSTTNSYKRLIPGFEAPVSLTYAASNRSAAIRIPHTGNPQARRLEARFPDPCANGYLAFAAMLMAGLDGINRKLDPGPAAEVDLYESQKVASLPPMAESLEEALAALDQDRAFLKAGEVFSDEVIDAFIQLKKADVASLKITPHPVEFKLYYSL